MKTYTANQARNLRARNFAATATDGTTVIVKAHLAENALRKAREYDSKIETVYLWYASGGGASCDAKIEVEPGLYEVVYTQW